MTRLRGCGAAIPVVITSSLIDILRKSDIMLGTIPELDSHYLKGNGFAGRTPSCLQVGYWTESDVENIFIKYGSSYSDISPLMQQLRENSGTMADDVEAGRPHFSDYRLLTRKLLSSPLDASALGDVDESWDEQLINIADNDNFYRGKLVYLAIRVGMLTQKNPFPGHGRIAAIVIAASAESLKGVWTRQNLGSVATSRDVGRDYVMRYDGESSYAIWNDYHRVYIVLPRDCFLGPGITGTVISTAYGVGWFYDGKLQNYREDNLLEANEVLGSQVPRPWTQNVMALIIATVFLVDKGHRLGLVGWSGVVSVLAQHKADETYATRRSAAAIFAVRSGRAKYASARDLTTSPVPTLWFPLLALAAEGSGSNSAWGACICAVMCFILIDAHRLRLQSDGLSDAQALKRAVHLANNAIFAPLIYRLGFYLSYASVISAFSFFLLLSNVAYATPRMVCCFICVYFVGAIVEVVITARLYGWDPNPSSTWLRLRWISFWLNGIASAFLYQGIEPMEIRSDEGKPKPYTLSGWMHREEGSDKASRYIVEYGTGSEVLSDDNPHLEDFYTKWSG